MKEQNIYELNLQRFKTCLKWTFIMMYIGVYIIRIYYIGAYNIQGHMMADVVLYGKRQRMIFH